MADTYYAEHPDPAKKGTRISRAKYDVIHSAMRTVLEASGPTALQPLIVAVAGMVGDEFEGSIPWYVTTIKLDMESKGELLCDRTVSPHLHVLQ